MKLCRYTLLTSLAVLAACEDGDPTWTTDRVDAVTPDEGLRWDWSELSCDGSWGWQSFEPLDGDGDKAGQWTVFPPRDFAVQVLGPDKLQRCLDLFDQGATACSVRFDAFELTLGDTGRLSMSIQPSELRQAAASGEISATRVADDVVEWVEDDAGNRTVLGVDLDDIRNR